jgi:protein-histidine N-methyltransferase
MADPSAPGELAIDPRLVDAFNESLKDHGVQLKFWAGSWSNFAPRGEGDGPFDLVITSETIYRSANVTPLLAVLRSASNVAPKTGFFSGLASLSRSQEVAPIVLVAAKVLYFGVGGSVDEFKSMAEATGATVTTVLDIELGVGRRILKLEFTP